MMGSRLACAPCRSYSFLKRLHAADVILQPIGPDGQFCILYLALFQLREQFMPAPAHDAYVLTMHPTAFVDTVRLAHPTRTKWHYPTASQFIKNVAHPYRVVAPRKIIQDEA